jgi:hypothetical protein
MRHLQFFARLGEKAELGLKSAEHLEWLERLEAEHNNVRAALAWALEGQAIGAGLQLASAQLGAESFAAAWAEGSLLTLDQVIAEAEQPIALPGSAPTSLPKTGDGNPMFA